MNDKKPWDEFKEFPWNEEFVVTPLELNQRIVSAEYLYQAFKERLMAELVAKHTSASAFYEDDKRLSGAPLIERKFVE